MESMPIWGWTVVIAAVVVGLIMWQAWAKARDLQARIDALSGKLRACPTLSSEAGGLRSRSAN